jgi:hypothetical protein
LPAYPADLASARRELFQQSREFRPRRGDGVPLRITPQLDYHIYAPETMARLAKRLTRHALEAIPVHRARRRPGAGNDPEPRLAQPVGSQIHPEMTLGARRPGRERFPVVIRTQQPRAARQLAGARDQTANLARPFARRARTTLRPPRVRIRTMKPCVRLRRVFDG